MNLVRTRPDIDTISQLVNLHDKTNWGANDNSKNDSSNVFIDDSFNNDSCSLILTESMDWSTSGEQVTKICN